MDEITELDENKYLVLKHEDIDNALGKDIKKFVELIQRVDGYRVRQGKTVNKYLVLNQTDQFDPMPLAVEIINTYERNRLNLPEELSNTVEDIAVPLVNSILRMKETQEVMEDKDLMDQIRQSREDYAAGNSRPVEEVFKELGI